MHFGTHYCGAWVAFLPCACKIKRGLWHLNMGTFYLTPIHLYLQRLMFPCVLCFLVLPWKSKPGALKLVLVRRRMCVRFMSSHPAASFWQSRFGQKIVLCKQAPKGGGRARGDMGRYRRGDTGDTGYMGDRADRANSSKTMFKAENGINRWLPHSLGSPVSVEMLARWSNHKPIKLVEGGTDQPDQQVAPKWVRRSIKEYQRCVAWYGALWGILLSFPNIDAQ